MEDAPQLAPQDAISPPVMQSLRAPHGHGHAPARARAPAPPHAAAYGIPQRSHAHGETAPAGGAAAPARTLLRMSFGGDAPSGGSGASPTLPRPEHSPGIRRIVRAASPRKLAKDAKDYPHGGWWLLRVDDAANVPLGRRAAVDAHAPPRLVRVALRSSEIGEAALCAFAPVRADGRVIFKSPPVAPAAHSLSSLLPSLGSDEDGGGEPSDGAAAAADDVAAGMIRVGPFASPHSLVTLALVKAPRSSHLSTHADVAYVTDFDLSTLGLARQPGKAPLIVPLDARRLRRRGIPAPAIRLSGFWAPRLSVPSPIPILVTALAASAGAPAAARAATAAAATRAPTSPRQLHVPHVNMEAPRTHIGVQLFVEQAASFEESEKAFARVMTRVACWAEDHSDRRTLDVVCTNVVAPTGGVRLLVSVFHAA